MAENVCAIVLQSANDSLQKNESSSSGQPSRKQTTCGVGAEF